MIREDVMWLCRLLNWIARIVIMFIGVSFAIGAYAFIETHMPEAAIACVLASVLAFDWAHGIYHDGF